MSPVVLAHSSLVAHATVSILSVAAVLAYLAAAARVERTTRWPPSRRWAWTAGIVALFVAVSPPVESLAERSFTGHMVQHLLMIIVAAPLLVAARPGRLFAAVTRRHPATMVGASSRRAWRDAAPLLAAGLFVGVLVVTHLTGIYDAAIRHQWVHDVEHIAYASSAVALWAAIGAAGRHHAARRIGAVFAVIGGTALLAMVLLTAPRPLIDSYVARLGTAEALDDQRRAASLMWITGMATTLPLLVLAFWRWATAEHRATLRAEALTDR